MDGLRAAVVAAIKAEAAENWNMDLSIMLPEEFDAFADRILAIPEIAEALKTQADLPDIIRQAEDDAHFNARCEAGRWE